MASGTVLDPRLPRVGVAAEQKLIAEAVRAALQHRGYHAEMLRWPIIDDPPGPTPARRHRRSRRARHPPDVAMLVNDLDKIRQVRSAQALIGTLDVPWLVLAGAPRGPAWGALYEMGAALIVSTSIGLEDLYGFVDDLHAGRTPLEPVRRIELIRAWRDFASHRGDLAVRFGLLTGREREVLQLLYQGHGVREVAELGEVTEATVRSQVKAILRKLEVNSQIAAVAVYQEVRSSFDARFLAGRGADPGPDA